MSPKKERSRWIEAEIKAAREHPVRMELYRDLDDDALRYLFWMVAKTAQTLAPGGPFLTAAESCMRLHENGYLTFVDGGPSGGFRVVPTLPADAAALRPILPKTGRH